MQQTIARKVNPFVERYISGAQELQSEASPYYRPGDESEARVCATELGVGWKSHPAFCEWLRACK